LYHAVEHLSKAAEHLYGITDSSVKQRWLNEQKEILFQGQAEWIANQLSQQAEKISNEGLRQEAGYFGKSQTPDELSGFCVQKAGSSVVVPSKVEQNSIRLVSPALGCVGSDLVWNV